MGQEAFQKNYEQQIHVSIHTSELKKGYVVMYLPLHFFGSNEIWGCFIRGLCVQKYEWSGPLDIGMQK